MGESNIGTPAFLNLDIKTVHSGLSVSGNSPADIDLMVSMDDLRHFLVDYLKDVEYKTEGVYLRISLYTRLLEIVTVETEADKLKRERDKLVDRIGQIDDILKWHEQGEAPWPLHKMITLMK